MPLADPIAKDLFEAGIVFAIFLGVALALRWTLHLTLNWLVKRADKSIRYYFKPIRTVIVWGVILSGLNVAVQGIDYINDRESLARWIVAGIGMAWVALAALAAVRIINAYFLLKDRHAAVDPEFRDRSTLLRKLAVGFVLVVGVLAGMRIGGLDIGPLLAGGAIGGVIVGLALQDSLSNVFAGLLLTMDGNIRVGEMLRFNDGPTASVENIGWRSSSLRLLDNTVLVVPNSQLSQDRFVNLSRPTLVTAIYIECGVAYDSDLEHVERVAIEVASTLQASLQGSEVLAKPLVRWRQFADSSVNFRLLMEIPEPRVQFEAGSDLLKAVHRRFREEGIEIPFPIRTMVMPPKAED